MNVAFLDAAVVVFALGLDIRRKPTNSLLLCVLIVHVLICGVLLGVLCRHLVAQQLVIVRVHVHTLHFIAQLLVCRNRHFLRYFLRELSFPWFNVAVRYVILLLYMSIRPRLVSLFLQDVLVVAERPRLRVLLHLHAHSVLILHKIVLVVRLLRRVKHCVLRVLLLL